MKTALIVDGSRLVRCVMKELLSEHGLQIVAEASDIPEAAKACRDHRPDLVTLDLLAAGGSSFDFIRRLRAQNPKVKVLAMIDSNQEEASKDALDSGAVAVLTKPLRPEDFVAALAKIGSAKRRVLVVDDSMVMREMLKGLLEEQGLEIAGEAGDVPEAIKAYGQVRPDLVTLDMVMPGGTGADVLKSIISEDPAAQVIVVTSVDQSKVSSELIDLGARAVLSKPLNGGKLEAALKLAAGGGRPNVEPRAPRLTLEAAATKTDALRAVLEFGGGRCGEAMSSLFQTPWAPESFETSFNAPRTGALAEALAETRESVAVRIIVDGETPMISLFLIDREHCVKMSPHLAVSQFDDTEDETIRLVAMEWANIALTNILNAFAEAHGRAILSLPPEFDQATPRDLVCEAAARLSVPVEGAVLSLNRFVCGGLGTSFRAVFVLPPKTLAALQGAKA